MLGVVLLAAALSSPVLAAAGESPATSILEQRLQDRPSRPHLAGHWEQDYARSDRWDDEMYRSINQLQREALVRHQRGDGGPWVLGNARRQARSVMAKARLAAMVTAQGAFEITQTDQQVRIERADDAPLICSTLLDEQDTFVSIHGRETCRWERRQLVFEVALPEGVTLQHRFSLDPGGDGLSVLTRVSSSDAPPFDLRHFYLRYESSAAAFRCVQTLSQGRVCSTAGPSEEAAP